MVICYLRETLIDSMLGRSCVSRVVTAYLVFGEMCYHSSCLARCDIMPRVWGDVISYLVLARCDIMPRFCEI